MRSPCAIGHGLLIIAIGMTSFASAQADIGDGTSVPDAERRIKACAQRMKGEPGQALLVDTTLDDLRAVAAFRELMEAHAPEGSVTLVSNKEPGERITVHGKVVNAQGKPVANAMVYAYQTDDRGWYAACCPHVLIHSGDHKHARLFAYVHTRADGSFELHTIMPKGYPRSDLPAHIHVHAWLGEASGGTEFQFADDPRMTPGRRKRSDEEGYLIAERKRGNEGPEYHYTLTID